MSVVITPARTPAGHLYCRISNDGDMDLADAETLIAAFNVGGPRHRWPILGFAHAGSKVSAEARRALATLSPEMIPLTVVVSASFATRLLMTVLSRIVGRPVHMEATEAEALAYLDERIPQVPKLGTAA